MLRLFIFGLLAGGTALSALTIEDAYPRYMEADLFKTVTEYVTGEERTGDRIVLRSQPGERSGQYFVVLFDENLRALDESAEAVLEVIPSDAKTAEVYRFPIGAAAKSTRQLYLGITGHDWPDGRLEPVAWRVRIEDGGEVLAEKQSFLWKMP